MAGVHFCQFYATEIAMISRKTNTKDLRGTGDSTRTLIWRDSLPGEWFFVAGCVSVLISRSLYICNNFFDVIHMSKILELPCNLYVGKAAGPQKSLVCILRLIITISAAYTFTGMNNIHCVSWSWSKFRSILIFFKIWKKLGYIKKIRKQTRFSSSCAFYFNSWLVLFWIE